jgi:hypothetical protein
MEGLKVEMKRDEFFFLHFGLYCDGFSTGSEYRIRGVRSNG